MWFRYLVSCLCGPQLFLPCVQALVHMLEHVLGVARVSNLLACCETQSQSLELHCDTYRLFLQWRDANAERRGVRLRPKAGCLHP